MAARANWNGVLKLGEVSCPVALYTAASTAERIAFHILNRKTGHRVHREFVDTETGKRVEAKEQVKGYETGAGEYIPFEPEEIAKAVPEADKTLEVEAFVPCEQVDDGRKSGGKVSPSDFGYRVRMLRPGAVAAGRDVVGALHAWKAPDDRSAAPSNGIDRDNRLRQGDPTLVAARVRAGHNLTSFGQPSILSRRVVDLDLAPIS